MYIVLQLFFFQLAVSLGKKPRAMPTGLILTSANGISLRKGFIIYQAHYCWPQTTIQFRDTIKNAALNICDGPCSFFFKTPTWYYGKGYHILAANFQELTQAFVH